MHFVCAYFRSQAEWSLKFKAKLNLYHAISLFFFVVVFFWTGYNFSGTEHCCSFWSSQIFCFSSSLIHSSRSLSNNSCCEMRSVSSLLTSAITHFTFAFNKCNSSRLLHLVVLGQFELEAEVLQWTLSVSKVIQSNESASYLSDVFFFYVLLQSQKSSTFQCSIFFFLRKKQ